MINMSIRISVGFDTLSSRKDVRIYVSELVQKNDFSVHVLTVRNHQNGFNNDIERLVKDLGLSETLFTNGESKSDWLIENQVEYPILFHLENRYHVMLDSSGHGTRFVSVDSSNWLVVCQQILDENKPNSQAQSSRPVLKTFRSSG